MFLKYLYCIVGLMLISISSIGQNIDRHFFELLDFNRPEFKKIAEYVEANNQTAASKDLLNYYRNKSNTFLNIGSEDSNYIESKFKQEVEESIETANQVLNQNFIFKYEWDMEKTNVPYQFKKEIDWSLIPFGDEEWCFMLNRHKFWIDLGKAYLFTGKEKYAKAFVNQVNNWIDNNPQDISLKSLTWRRIEAGIRCINWIKSFEYIKNSKHVTPEFLIKFLKSLHQHAEYINSSFNYFSKTSNWGVIEYNGLFTLSNVLSEFKNSAKWRVESIEKLTTCINLQVLSDGSHWEQSPMYHNEVFHCYLNVNYLAQKNNIILPEDILHKTKAMAYANVQWQKPNYHQPLLGDSDDTDLRGLLTTAAYLFSDSVLKSRAYKTFDYDNIFLFGCEAIAKYEKLEESEPAFLSVYQKGAGNLYMRNSWDNDATFASLHLKKLGCGHGHDNLLHFTLFANGRDYLVDGGRFTYVNNTWRSYFKSSMAHNTLSVDGEPNSIYSSSWTNKYEARSQGAFTYSDSNFDYGEAENTAYKRLDDPVLLKRRVLYLKNENVFLIFDSFDAHDEHVYSQYFNFPNKLVESAEGIISTTYKNNNLVIRPMKDVDMKFTDEWWSPEYNLKTESKRLEMFKKAEGFTSFISVLYFPESTNLSCELVPVYSRNDALISEKDAEAIHLKCNNKEYTIMLVHNSPVPAAHFYKVNHEIVSGEFVVVETEMGEVKKHIIKE